MNILVIGSGGREYAICWKLSEDEKINNIYCAPGNGGTKLLPKTQNIDIKKVDELISFAKKNCIDITIVGSEELLVKGIVDEFKNNDLKIIGPDKKAAMLEGSKAYAKKFMKKYGIKTADYQVFNNSDLAKKYLEKCNYPIVIKASGLAAGKGVIISNNYNEAIAAVEDIMEKKIFNDAGDEVVIEEYLEGVEASILSITDCKQIIPFISAKDHKKIGEKETGLNTGGMGAIAPNPYVNEKVYNEFYSNILIPTLNGIKEENLDFCGFIFFGLMITKKGVYLLEYNMRLGDPETQAVLPLLKTKFLDILTMCLEKKLEKNLIKWDEEGQSCCVVMAAGGYPEKYEKGNKIEIGDITTPIFLAGVKEENNELFTNGGRVLNVVAVGKNLDDARKIVYENIKKISFKNAYYRKDI